MKTKAKKGRGRPSKYQPRYCKEIVTFFNVNPYKIIKGIKIANDLKFLSAFARKVGVCHETLHEWDKVHPDFSVAYKKAKELQERNLVTCGLHGLYQQPFAIFTAKNICGWRDKKEVEHIGKDKDIIVIYPPAYKKTQQEEQKEGDGNKTETIPGRVPVVS